MEIMPRRNWSRNEIYERYPGSERGRYGYSDEERRRRYAGADYENSEYFPDAESGWAGGYRRMGDETERWNREGAFRDYYGPGGPYYGGGYYNPGYGYRERYPSRGRDYGRDYGEERGFFERAGDEVASWFGDEEAERRRQMDQYRGKGPKGYTRSDSRIKEDVSDRLSDDGALDASNIEVSVTNGEVQLSGFVDSRWAKRRAEDCAEDVSGVTHVQNNIRVRTSGSSGTTGSTSGWTGGETDRNL